MIIFLEIISQTDVNTDKYRVAVVETTVNGTKRHVIMYIHICMLKKMTNESEVLSLCLNKIQQGLSHRYGVHSCRHKYYIIYN